jgi:hypothetical protein
VFPSVDVDSGTTSVQSFRQSSRTLADPTAMVRAIDATSMKPETDTTTEVVTEALKQVANVSTGTPNVLLESPAFRDFVETDLRLAFGDAMDAHVVGQLAAMNPPDVGSVANLLKGARRAITLIQAAGYTPSVIAASPEDLEALDLLMSSGPEMTYQFALTATGPNAANLWGLRRVAVKDLWHRSSSIRRQPGSCTGLRSGSGRSRRTPGRRTRRRSGWRRTLCWSSSGPTRSRRFRCSARRARRGRSECPGHGSDLATRGPTGPGPLLGAGPAHLLSAR